MTSAIPITARTAQISIDEEKVVVCWQGLSSQFEVSIPRSDVVDDQLLAAADHIVFESQSRAYEQGLYGLEPCNEVLDVDPPARCIGGPGPVHQHIFRLARHVSLVR